MSVAVMHIRICSCEYSNARVDFDLKNAPHLYVIRCKLFDNFRYMEAE